LEECGDHSTSLFFFMLADRRDQMRDGQISRKASVNICHNNYTTQHNQCII
jgi:hypothetical protein